MAAGLRVRRADPPMLPDRPRFGSVPAEEIALAARSHPDRTVLLERHRGTQTGREDELAAAIAGSADADRRHAAAGRCLSHGDRGRREVALTFDDGPLPPYTDRVLDVLEGYGVPATFFCVGTGASRWTEHLARMREQDHAVGNHTWSHPFLTELSDAELTEQLDRTAEAIAPGRTGTSQMFRPPYGCRTPEILDRLAARDDVTTVLWDVAPDDWALRTSDDIAVDVLAGTRPGSVVLLHDGGGDRSATVASLPRIVEGLLDDGYTFVRADDMVERTRSELVSSS